MLSQSSYDSSPDVAHRLVMPLLAAAAAAAADADSVAIGDIRRAPYSCSLFRSQWSRRCCHRVTSYRANTITKHNIIPAPRAALRSVRIAHYVVQR